MNGGEHGVKPRWLITGAGGFLGSAFAHYAIARGDAVLGLTRTHSAGVAQMAEECVDLTDHAALADVMRRFRPTHVLHAAAMTDVDACEAAPDAARQANVDATASVASETAEVGAALCYISTDQLWDGTISFVEESVPPTPLNVYGRTKWLGEQKALVAHPEALIIRTNFFGAATRTWHKSVCNWLAAKLASGEGITGFADVYYTPVGLGELCILLLKLMDCHASGIYNVVGSERLSKYDFARLFAEKMGFDPALVRKGTTSDVALRAARPSDMSLSAAKVERFLGCRMPTVGECLDTLIDGWRGTSDDSREDSNRDR